MMKMQLEHLLPLLLVQLTLLVFAGATAKIDCENTDDIKENNIHLCCKHPGTHDAVVDNCAKETGFHVYYNSKNQSEALLEVSADRAIASTCFGKCIFEKYAFLDKDNNLCMETVRKHYNDIYAKDQEYVREMINAFDHCHGQAEEKLAKFLATDMFHDRYHKACDPKPSVIWACVVREFFHNCPNDRWQKTQECVYMREFSKQCPDVMSTL